MFLARGSLPTALALATTVALACSSAALADNNDSSNWGGYAVHRSGVKFRSVFAEWRQPSASCASGRQTYSAYWVGLGGYAENSTALEQVGTEVDCSPAGRVESSAWYELVPAASQSISLRVRPGDAIGGNVTVVGRRVTVVLDDFTTRRAFSKTLHASSVDVSSADWIVEAPADCISENSCQTLPLADFGSATFVDSAAQTTTGHVGTISNRAWGRTKITLTPGGRQFAKYNGAGPEAGVATPSALRSNGSSFTVRFSAVSVQGSPFYLARAPTRLAGYLVHPGR